MKKVLLCLGIAIILYFLSFLNWYIILNKTWPINSKRIVMTGHRGAAAIGPENTLASIKAALLQNVDRIEIDIQETKDGEIVLMHDLKLDRTTNGSGHLRNMDYDEIKDLNAGEWFDSTYRLESIPILEEVFPLVPDSIDLVIEIKSGRGYKSSTESILIDKIKKAGMLDQCIIHCFDSKVLRRIHLIEPTIRLHQLIVFKLGFLPLAFTNRLEFIGQEELIYADEVSINYLFATRNSISFFKTMDKKVNVWTLDNPTKLKCLMHLGIDCVITNSPGKLRALN